MASTWQHQFCFRNTLPALDNGALCLLSVAPVCCEPQWKVRRTLAFSIHELAVILGDQLTAADLVPIFNGFLKDLDEVRIGVLKHLYDFLKVGRGIKNKMQTSLPLKTALTLGSRVSVGKIMRASGFFS